MPERREVSELVNRISSASDGTGPQRKGSAVHALRKRSALFRGVLVLFDRCTKLFGTVGLLCLFGAAIAVRVTHDYIFLLLAVPAIPWAMVGYFSRMDDS